MTTDSQIYIPFSIVAVCYATAAIVQIVLYIRIPYKQTTRVDKNEAAQVAADGQEEKSLSSTNQLFAPAAKKYYYMVIGIGALLLCFEGKKLY